MGLRKFPKALALGLLMTMLLSLTGCLYPDDQQAGKNVSAREAVLTVQDAVDRYQEKTGVLPIQNAEDKVPLYEKYKIDFGKLKRMNFISQVPSAAFESGGDYQFLIIDEETKPLVKLIDLAMFQTLSGVQKKVDEYRRNNNSQNPAGEEIYSDFSLIDFSKLGIKAPKVQSMYSNQSLNLLVNKNGQVLVDYGIDIAVAINKEELKPNEKEDLRRVLIEASYYVPVRSPVYHWVDNEPKAVLTP
ncbi:hypothetical protein [Cohnella abietis]|uniref:Lipoprotein n=1 Tax=Cohnella abietis TaxID=2507935 RepID=A0A3T1D5A0_9BACL|nr:hypothetical protein [Cohnella abietis]BBI33189.1 hypothetical protein KCTCHS21_25880 [Cohnella abietis]